jgi:hypothetical protein
LSIMTEVSCFIGVILSIMTEMSCFIGVIFKTPQS